MFKAFRRKRHLRRLKSAVATEREDAVLSLADLGGTGLVEPLIHATFDRSPNVRAAATYAIGKLGDRIAVERLLQLLADDDRNTRRNAAGALANLGEPLWKDWVVGNSDDVSQLVKCGDSRAIVPLSWAAENGCDPAAESSARSRPSLRIRAISALAELGGTAAVETLVRVLDCEDPEVRKACAKVLARLADPRTLEPLTKAANDVDRSVREVVREALRQVDDAVNCPEKAVKHADPEIRRKAVESLRESSDRCDENLLVEAMSDQSTEVRRAAVKSWKRLVRWRAVDMLIKALNDWDHSVRSEAVSGLKQLSEPRSVLALITLGEREKMSHFPHNVADALLHIGDPRGVRWTVDLLLKHVNDIKGYMVLRRVKDDRESRRSIAESFAGLIQRYPQHFAETWSSFHALFTVPHADRPGRHGDQAPSSDCRSPHDDEAARHRDNGKIGINFPSRPPKIR